MARLSLRRAREPQRPDWLAGAPGFEPGNGGIKIRCLTTWLRLNSLRGGKLSGKLLRGNKTARGAPPARLGGRERLTGALSCIASAEQGKARRAAAAHSRQQSPRERAKPRQHSTDLGHEAD